jgi:hypothetical protein
MKWCRCGKPIEYSKKFCDACKEQEYERKQKEYRYRRSRYF